jgi:hypothetical protein
MLGPHGREDKTARRRPRRLLEPLGRDDKTQATCAHPMTASTSMRDATNAQQDRRTGVVDARRGLRCLIVALG